MMAALSAGIGGVVVWRSAALIAEQERVFLRGQSRSAELLAEARQVLAGGGTSSWQIARPQMIWLSHGAGSTMVDADGRSYVDMHGGYGVGVADTVMRNLNAKLSEAQLEQVGGGWYPMYIGGYGFGGFGDGMAAITDAIPTSEIATSPQSSASLWRAAASRTTRASGGTCGRIRASARSRCA